MKELSAKKIQEKLGEGWGYSSLANYAECTVEELKEYLNSRQFNRKQRREYNSRLEKNEKVFLSRKRRSKPLAGSISQDICEPVQTTSDAKNVSVDEALDTEPEKGDSSVKDTVESVLARIDEVKDKIVKLEHLHKDICSERWALKEKLRPLQDEYLQMQKRLKTMEEETCSIKLRLSTTDDELSAINAEKAVFEQERDDLERKLDSLTKKEIYVEANGDITDETGATLIAPDTWQEIFQSWRDEPSTDCYTGLEIKLASRVVAIVLELTSSYVVVVDSNRVSALLAMKDIPTC